MASAKLLIAKSGQFAMLSRALWMKGVGNTSTHRAVCLTVQRRLQSQDSGAEKQSLEFDERVLEHLVCPLSKKDLRYDKERSELVCDELGVAYPIVDGIPNLVPQDARMIKSKSTDSTES